jgi:hypothetical protein
MELFKIFGTIGLKGVNESEKELKDLTNNAEKSSSKLSKIGSVMKGIGKGVLITTGAVATAGIGLIKSVSSSYGALQQSIGGIETLFKDSADKVIKNANNAFTTAGISANDYMQQVTSFSASLLQALGGDTEKACDSADMAIRDMADNANKMGTSMEMIQNAYQGFSKQNYTMLDNLKLGYGGTKTEMERLLKDAQKITGIKYDISNLNDVYQAIHVIQGELGITGTTAKEAGETIEGSFNSLGASWQNFLAGLGDPNADMKMLVDNLAKGINGAIKNITPIIENMVQALPTVVDSLLNAVMDMLPTLINTFTDLIQKVLDAIIQVLPQFVSLALDCVLKVTDTLLQNLPLIVSAGMQLLLGLAQGIADALPTLLPLIVQVVVEVVNILLENIPLIIEIGTQLLLGLVQGLTEAIPMLIEMLPSLIEKIITTLINCLPLLIDCGIQLNMALMNGMIKAIPSLIKAIPQILMGIFKSLINGIPKMLEAGQKLMGGVLGGIKKAFGGVIDFFKNNWSTILLFIVNPFAGAFKLLYDKCDKFRNFFNGIINNVKNAWNSFCNFLKNAIKLPHFTFSGSMNPADWFNGKTPKIGVEWYADGGIMTKPTAFGYNPMTGNTMIGGESGAEAIVPLDRLQGYVTTAVKEQTSDLTYGMNKLIDLLSTYLPDIRDNMDRPIMLDSNKVVNATARKMDSKLGDIMTSKARFGV